MTAPINPIVAANAYWGIYGTKSPDRISEILGPMIIRFIKKQKAIKTRKNANNDSNLSWPRNFTRRSRKALNMLSKTPMEMGMSNRILSAIEDPSTSWMSDPIIAISVITHSVRYLDLGKCSRQSTAKSFYAYNPSLSE